MGSGILARHAVGRGAPRGRGRRGRRRRHHDRRVRLRITPRAEALDALVSPRRGGCRVRSVQPRDVARGSEERDRARRGRGRARCRRRAREARGGSQWGNRSVVRDLGGPRSAREAVADGPAPRRRRRRIRRRRRRDLDAAFDRAAKTVASTNRKLTNDQKLRVYALFKQSTVGANDTRKPRLLEGMAKHAKWSAWNELGDLARDDAKEAYIDLVTQLCGNGRNERGNESDDVVRGRRRGWRRRRRARRAGLLQAADAIRSR